MNESDAVKNIPPLPGYVSEETRRMIDAVVRYGVAVCNATKASGQSATANTEEDRAIREIAESLGFRTRADVAAVKAHIRYRAG